MARKILIHFHLPGGRVVTRDATPPSLADQYQDLMERLMAALSRHGHKTSDDAEGDPLGHWITLSGAHVFINGKGEIIKGPAHLVGKHKDDLADTTQAKKAPPAKGVKATVHQLLSTGHPFSFEELKAATGAKLNQQLHNAMNELKAGKGALGQLTIQKVGQHYQVVKPNGEPAIALSKMPDEAKKFAAEANPGATGFSVSPEQEAIPKVPKAPTLTPEPIVAPSPVPAPPESFDATGYDMPEFTWKTTPVTTPISKAEADKIYAKQLDDANSFAAGLAAAALDDPESTPGGLPEVAKDWKQSKATSMAQWANHVKGGDHQPKPVEVYPEDIHLMNVLASASGKAEYDAAVANWKSATAQAKVKATAPLDPGKAAAQGMKPTPAIKADETPIGGHTLSAPDALVPEGHQHIQPSDFVGTPGKSSSPYVQQISHAHKLLHASASTNASVNKANVQQGLEKRLGASPHFETMAKQYKAAHGGSLASAMIQAWAGSSGDHQPRSVAAQLAIRDVFKMNPDEVETKAFHLLSKSNASEEEVYKQAAQAYGVDVKTPAKLESFKAGMRDFALAQYHETQDHLAQLGIKELYLVRGMKFGDSNAQAQEVNIKLQPASSFTTDHSTARSFAGGHSLFTVRVPASQVLSSFCTGFGCTSESEVVVLNHKSLKAVQVGSKNAESATSMSSHIAKTLGGPSVQVKEPPKPDPSLGTKGGVAMQAYNHVMNGEYDKLNQMKADMESGAPLGSYMGAVKQYVDQLHAHVNGKPKTAKKSTGSSSAVFKPHSLPSKQTGVSSGWYKKLTDAAKAGDLDQLNEHMKTLSGLKLPNSKTYANALHTHVTKQHAEWVAKQASKVNHATQAQPAVGGVKKNAHYYKKLKEKILAHPEHSEGNYNLGKSQGMTNEQILAQYEKVHQQNKKEPV